MKYLVYSFKNAGIIKPKPKDYISSDYGRIEVPDGTLYVNHVYNMLAIMFGERPSRTFKTETFKGLMLEKIDKIFDMASDSFVEINNLQSYSDTNGKSHSVTEKMLQTRFAHSKNSWSKPNFVIKLDGELKTIQSVMPSWNTLELFISNKTKFDSLCEHIKRITCIVDIKKYSVVSLIERLNISKDEELLKFFESNKYTNLINLIYKPSVSAFTWHQINWGHTPEYHRCFVTKSPIDIQRISGKIYVPIKDEQYTYERLNIGTIFSTLLEGGFVELEEIKDYWNPLNHNVNKVFQKEI